MKMDIGDGLYIVAGDNPERVCLVDAGRMPIHLNAPATKVAAKAVQLARIIHLTGELERLGMRLSLDTGDSPDAFIVRSPEGYFGTINGENFETETASDAARLIHGLPGSLQDKVTETLETP